MISTHTDYASERIEDLVATDIASIWADLEQIEGKTDSKKWASKFNTIAKEYLLSSRFALMRILCKRALPNLKKDCDLHGICYSVEIGEETLSFCDISLEHAYKLTPEEHTNYIKYLLDIAGPSPKDCSGLHEHIIFRAWHNEESANMLMKHTMLDAIRNDPKQCKKYTTQIEKVNKKRYGTIFTREEAFLVGHVLKFTLEEMQWFLLRVFDVEDGFRMNRSSDLIEAYCFLTGASCSKAEDLKERFGERTQAIEKRDDYERTQNWTRQTVGGLLERVESWKLYPETMDENFLAWLVDRASGLDLLSHTATRIYRNLAAYAYAGDLPPEEYLYDELLHISDMDEDSEEALEHLYCDGTISKSKCQQVAEHLYWENKTITDSEMKDNTKTWSVVTTRKDKELSVSYGTVNSSRTRIQSLLLGIEEVEKSDLLYLLWFTCNLVWSDTATTDKNIIYDRIFDLKEAASAFLNNALLPPFYPPHLVEQSMLLSIIYAGKTGTDPAVIYGSVLQSLRDTRARGKKSGKHTLQDKLAIINDYREHAKMTLNQCAEKYRVSEQSLSRWQKELIEAGLIDANHTTK